MVTERAGDLRGFRGFANAIIGMVAGADKFIELDNTDPEKPAESMLASLCPVKHDENQPERLDQ